ncbi:MAG: SLAC1 anion channel family protein [Gammaproteobacteria bacterium]
MPVSFFAMVMGLAGLTIAWEKAESVLALPAVIHLPMLALTVATFVTLAIAYTVKFTRYRPAVVAEWRHPVKLSFFPATSISLLLLSIALMGVSAAVAQTLWSLGALLHLGLTLFVLNSWLHHDHYETHHINPAWFIPAVGNVIVPVAGVELGHTEISWFFFSIGMLFWLVLMVIVFYRMMFHAPLPDRLMPTLFILIAPPAVGFIAYLKLSGEVDAFARVLYFSALFLTLMMLTQARRFLALSFYLSWWAYSFPLAAISIASLSLAEKTGTVAFATIGAGLLVLLSLVVLVLLTQTLRHVHQRRICVPEG